MKKTLSKILIGIVLSLAVHIAVAATDNREERQKVNFPTTDIFLFELDLTKTSIANGKNVTHRRGYDNQPFFTPNSESFVFSRADDYQTDVYEYWLKTGEIRQVTNSDATEFSPTPVLNNSKIAFVSDRNGGIWLAPRESANEPTWLLESMDNREPVGYFAWNTENNDLIYWSRYGFSLAHVNLSTQAYHFISGNTPPSTPHIIPNTNTFSFVHRQTNGQVWIKSYDPSSRAITPLIPVQGENYNYNWAPNGTIWMIQNNHLFTANPATNTGWQRLADLGQYQIKQANRLAISSDGKNIAIVGVATN